MVTFKVAKRRLMNEIKKNKTGTEMIKTMKFYIKEFKEIRDKANKSRKNWMI